MNNIDILVSFDDTDYNLLNWFFKPTLSKIDINKSFSVLENKISNQSEEGFGFLSQRYISSRIKQFDYIIKYIESNLTSEKYAISADSDIIFFPSFYKNLFDSIKDSLSLYFMPENIEQSIPNIGFIVFKTDPDSLKTFQHIRNIYQTHDSNLIKDISQNIQTYIDTNQIKSKILDINFSNNNFSTKIFNKLVMSGNISCFHATSSFNILEKINLLSKTIRHTKKYNKNFVVNQGMTPQSWKCLLSTNDDISIIEYSSNEQNNILKKNEKNNKNLLLIDNIRYIIDNYDSLPEFTFFASDDLFYKTEFIKYIFPDNLLNDLCDVCSLQGGFYCLGERIQKPETLHLKNKEFTVSLWYLLDNIFDLDKENLSQIQCCDVAGCYIIKKKNILNRPKSFYEKILNFISANEYNYDIVDNILYYIFNPQLVLKNTWENML